MLAIARAIGKAAQTQKKRNRSRAYYWAHREKMRASQRAYYKADAVARRDYAREYRRRNRRRVKARDRARARARREGTRARQKAERAATAPIVNAARAKGRPRQRKELFCGAAALYRRNSFGWWKVTEVVDPEGYASDPGRATARVKNGGMYYLLLEQERLLRAQLADAQREAASRQTAGGERAVKFNAQIAGLQKMLAELRKKKPNRTLSEGKTNVSL